MDRYQLSNNNSINRLIGTAAVIPGILMCLITAFMLIADIVYSGMDTAQYTVYPVMYRICSVITAACAIVCLRSAVMRRQSGLDAATVLLGVFAFWMVLSTSVNGMNSDALYGVPFRYLGVTDFIICLAGFMGCSTQIRSERLKNIILSAYMVTADLVGAAALFDRAAGGIAAFGNKSGLSAVFFHENHYGYFLVMAVLISAGYCIYGEGRLAAAGMASFVINLAALGINQTMGCILAVGFVIILLIVISLLKDRAVLRRVLILTSFLAIAALAAVIVSKAVRDDVRQLVFDIGSITWGGNHGLAGHGRWQLWSETTGYIKERPLLGYGCEGIRGMLKDVTGVASPHSEVLTYAAFFGIPGALAYAAGMILTMIKSVREERTGIAGRIALMASCGYLASSMFGVAIFYTLPFFFVFAGMCISGEDEC